MTAADAFLDTNVLVYAIDSASSFHEKARSVLSSTRNYDISPQIIFEFLSLVTHAKRVRSPLRPDQAKQALRLILARPNVEVLPIDREAMDKALSLASKHKLVGPRVFDALVAGVMLQHKIPVIITANVKHFQSLGIAAESL